MFESCFDTTEGILSRLFIFLIYIIMAQWYSCKQDCFLFFAGLGREQQYKKELQFLFVLHVCKFAVCKFQMLELPWIFFSKTVPTHSGISMWIQ